MLLSLRESCALSRSERQLFRLWTLQHSAATTILIKNDVAESEWQLFAIPVKNEFRFGTLGAKIQLVNAIGILLKNFPVVMADH